MSSELELIAKLQRQAKRRARHLLGLSDKNDSLRYELRKLQKVLRAIHGKATNPDAARSPEELLGVIADIVEKTIPNELRRYPFEPGN